MLIEMESTVAPSPRPTAQDSSSRNADGAEGCPLPEGCDAIVDPRAQLGLDGVGERAIGNLFCCGLLDDWLGAREHALLKVGRQLPTHLRRGHHTKGEGMQKVRVARG